MNTNTALCLAALLAAAPAAALEESYRAAGAIMAQRAPMLPVFCPTPAAPRPAPAPAAEEAPAFTLKDTKGNPVSLSQFKGKVVLLDFWATWCPPCRLSTPYLISLHDELASKGLVVLAINMGEDAAAIDAYAAKHQIPYQVLMADDSVGGEYRVPGLPTFIIVGKDGKIAWRQSGFGEKLKPAFRQAVDAALAAK